MGPGRRARGDLGERLTDGTARSGVPSRMISQLRLTPDVALTRADGLAEALHVLARGPRSLIRKLQCISETFAPPMRNPRQPASSMRRQALVPGGFLNVEPPVRSLIGWLRSR